MYGMLKRTAVLLAGASMHNNMVFGPGIVDVRPKLTDNRKYLGQPSAEPIIKKIAQDTPGCSGVSWQTHATA
jgi:hypothetical protein